MMLKPTMSELLELIPNRYLLVNVAAKRARDIADAAEQAKEPLAEKPVKLALYDIIDGRVRPAEGRAQQEDEEEAEEAELQAEGQAEDAEQDLAGETEEQPPAEEEEENEE